VRWWKRPRGSPRNKGDTVPEARAVSDEVIYATVTSIVTEGKHGPYFVASSPGMASSVTCSLDASIWEGNRWPEVGQNVVLTELVSKSAGWRAMKGRPVRPSDEQATRNQQSATRKE